MTELRFWKYQSVGNDFVLIHRDEAPVDTDWVALALAACRRRFGIGSDGLLVVGMDGDVLTLRMFNPDGTEDFCGNGIRCAAWHAFREGWIGPSALVSHLGRTVRVWVPQAGVVRSESPSASFAPNDFPHLWGREMRHQKVDIRGRAYDISCLSTGSAHTVILCASLPDDDEFFPVSEALEHHANFPDRTSVIWVQSVEPDQIRLRIWERGAGETMGCGTGSLAAAVVWAERRGYWGPVHVVNPGGTIEVNVVAEGEPLFAEARTSEVFQGRLRCGSPACLQAM